MSQVSISIISDETGEVVREIDYPTGVERFCELFETENPGLKAIPSQELHGKPTQ